MAVLWIDRQPKMNTMTVAMRNEFPGIFAGLEADESVRVVVVRGAGGKAFSAGGDVAGHGAADLGITAHDDQVPVHGIAGGDGQVAHGPARRGFHREGGNLGKAELPADGVGDGGVHLLLNRKNHG